MAKKSKKLKNKKKNQKSKGMGKKTILYLFCIVVFMVISPPTAILLFFGMLPTLVAYVVDRTPDKNKALTIGALNFAGCYPFLLKLWVQPDALQQVTNYLTNFEAIIITYGAAALGYVLNWFICSATVNLTAGQNKGRIKRIEEKKEQLIERWGEKVNGNKVLGADGFPVETGVNYEEAD